MEACSSFPKAFTTLIPPSCSSTSVVIFASASLTFKDTPIALDEKLEANHKTIGIERSTMPPSGRLRLNKVPLNISSRKIFADASGAMAKASLTCDASLEALAIKSPVGTLS